MCLLLPFNFLNMSWVPLAIQACSHYYQKITRPVLVQRPECTSDSISTQWKKVNPSFLYIYFRHLESVRPLCDDNEFNKFVQLGQEFESTLGTKLQRWLQLKWWTSDNYVSDWWEEYVYLRGKFWIIIF